MKWKEKSYFWKEKNLSRQLLSPYNSVTYCLKFGNLFWFNEEISLGYLIFFFFLHITLVDYLMPNHIEQILEATTYKTITVWPPHSLRKLSVLDEPDMKDTAGEVRMNL